MANRQNIAVDVARPSSRTDLTAIGILNALKGQGWVYSRYVDREIRRAHGYVSLKGDAVKALRNMGYPLSSVKARHLSRYRLYAEAPEMEGWSRRVLEESYSQLVTTTRSLAGALSASSTTDPVMVGAHTASEMATIQIGRQLDKSLGDILADLQPI
jgi:hypothetical protein